MAADSSIEPSQHSLGIFQIGELQIMIYETITLTTELTYWEIVKRFIPLY